KPHSQTTISREGSGATWPKCASSSSMRSFTSRKIASFRALRSRRGSMILTISFPGGGKLSLRAARAGEGFRHGRREGNAKCEPRRCERVELPSGQRAACGEGGRARAKRGAHPLPVRVQGGALHDNRAADDVRVRKRPQQSPPVRGRPWPSRRG